MTSEARFGPEDRPGDLAGLSRRQFLVGSSAALATAALLAACGAGKSSSGPAGGGAGSRAPVSVRISTGKTVETANFFVADAQGYYKKHGLAATLTSFTIPVNGADAMLAGTEDVSELVQLPFLNFVKNGADIIIVANTCTSRNVYLVTKSKISKPSDLVGAKIGFPFSTGQQYAFVAYLQHVGIPANKVKMVNVQNENLVAAMSAGSIDGFLGIQPQVSQTLSDVQGTHIMENPPATSAFVSPEYLVLERSWAQSNRKTVEAILSALIDANSFIKSDKAETAKIMAPVMGLPASKVETLMGPNPTGDDDDFSITLDQTTVSDSLKGVATWMMSTGLLKTMPDIAHLIDPSFLRAVDPSLVTGQA
jgi:ABC-type nitrate/sulfonate/bicarbonate transport system substrate-binding protein